MRNVLKQPGMGRITVSGILTAILAMGCPGPIPGVPGPTGPQGPAGTPAVTPVDPIGGVEKQGSVKINYVRTTGNPDVACNWRVGIRELLGDGTVGPELVATSATATNCAPTLQYQHTGKTAWMVAVLTNTDGRVVRGLFQPNTSETVLTLNAFTEGATSLLITGLALNLKTPATITDKHYNSVRDTLMNQDPCRAQAGMGQACSTAQIAASLRVNGTLWAPVFSSPCFVIPSKMCAGGDFNPGALVAMGAGASTPFPAVDTTGNVPPRLVADSSIESDRAAVAAAQSTVCLPSQINGAAGINNISIQVAAGGAPLTVGANAVPDALGFGPTAAAGLLNTTCTRDRNFVSGVIPAVNAAIGTAATRATFNGAFRGHVAQTAATGVDVFTSTTFHGNGYLHESPSFVQRSYAATTCVNVVNTATAGAQIIGPIRVNINVPAAVATTTAVTGDEGQQIIVPVAGVAGWVNIPRGSRAVAFGSTATPAAAGRVIVIGNPGSAEASNSDGAVFQVGLTGAAIASITWPARSFAQAESASFCFTVLEITTDGTNVVSPTNNWTQVLSDSLLSATGRFQLDMATLNALPNPVPIAGAAFNDPAMLNNLALQQKGIAVMNSLVFTNSPAACDQRLAQFANGSIQGNDPAVVPIADRKSWQVNMCSGLLGGSPGGQLQFFRKGATAPFYQSFVGASGNECVGYNVAAGEEIEVQAEAVLGATRKSCKAQDTVTDLARVVVP